MNKNVTATILIVLAVGVYLTFTSSRWQEVKAIRAVNAEYIQAISNADELIKVRDQVLANYNAFSAEDRDRLNKIVPDTVDNIRLIIDLNNVASRRGVTLQNVKAGTEGESPTTVVRVSDDASYIPTPILDTVDVSFNVSAPYTQFIAFMRDLESNLRIMDLKSLTISADDSGTYDFGVELTTYWLRQQ